MSKRILVVDDQPDLRLLIRLSLRQLGEVLQAESAEQALSMMAATPPFTVWLPAGDTA